MISHEYDETLRKVCCMYHTQCLLDILPIYETGDTPYAYFMCRVPYVHWDLCHYMGHVPCPSYVYAIYTTALCMQLYSVRFVYAALRVNYAVFALRNMLCPSVAS